MTVSFNCVKLETFLMGGLITALGQLYLIMQAISFELGSLGASLA